MLSLLPRRRGTQNPLGVLGVQAAGGSHKSPKLGWGVWACRGSACCCWGNGPGPRSSYTPALQLPPGPCTPERRNSCWFHLRQTARCHASFSLRRTHNDLCTLSEKNNEINRTYFSIATSLSNFSCMIHCVLCWWNSDLIKTYTQTKEKEKKAFYSKLLFAQPIFPYLNFPGQITRCCQ